MGAVGVVLIPKLRMQQLLFCIDARKERRNKQSTASAIVSYKTQRYNERDTNDSPLSSRMVRQLTSHAERDPNPIG